MSTLELEGFISEEEYLEGELRSEIRHEYINGKVYAMSGASEEHNLISLNLATLLRNHLRGTPCRTFIADMKTRIRSLKDDRFYYPDVQVTCGAADNDRYFKEQPKLVIEVLSPATQRADREEKFYYYRSLESLEEYLLIAQDARRVELYRRAGNWEMEVAEVEGELRLDSVGLTLSLDHIYEDVNIRPREPKSWIDDKPT